MEITMKLRLIYETRDWVDQDIKDISDDEYNELMKNYPSNNSDYDSSNNSDYDSDYVPDYVPDDFYALEGSITFIYKDRLIYSNNQDDMHMDLVSTNSKELFGVDQISEVGDWGTVRSKLEDLMLTGRIGVVEDRPIVVFWNTTDQLHGKLDDCLNELMEEGLVDANTLVYIQGVKKPHRVNDIITNKISQANIDTKEMERIEKLKQLHTMNAGDKKRAMKELGLGGEARKRPGQPGVKWWALQSENTIK